MKLWKKIIIVVTTMLVLNLALVGSYEQARASVISKPLTITAKKVAKDLASDTAVEMANQIVSELLVRELIEGVTVDNGYSAVCMDGARNNMKDCPVEKRAQIKNLDSSDKQRLENKVEQILEQKTHTSAKWQKFLDWFVPIFLVAGLVEFFHGAITDGDINSFFDEIAQESLIELQLLKPLTTGFEEQKEMYDFTEHVESVNIEFVENDGNEISYSMKMILKANKTLDYEHVYTTYGDVKRVEGVKGFDMELGLGFSFVSLGSGSSAQFYGISNIPKVQKIAGSFYNVPQASVELYRGGKGYPTYQEAKADAASWVVANLVPMFTTGDMNTDINNFIGLLNLTAFNLQFTNVTTYVPVPPNIETDYGTQQALQNLTGPEGKVPLKGIESFTYTFGDVPVYPSPDSTTGWKDKTTGTDITVIEDEVVVDGGEVPPGTDEEDKPEDLKACEKNLKDIEFKKVGTAFTYAFPFSIPWDIKRFIDNSFSGVGSEKPSVNLSFLGDGVTLTIPDYFDRWIPFVHGLLVIVFDLALVYLFYRFMKGGGD